MPDRSNMRRVETTNDKEKREAFKARLVERIATHNEVALESFPAANHIPIGSLVWHQDFGPCVVHSVSLETNTITLTTETLGNVDMVLSVVESKLRPIDESEVPRQSANPFAKLIEAPKPDETPEDLTLAVTLPNFFPIMTTKEQYQYLTSQAHFPPEKASAFIFNHDDYTITWEEFKAPADTIVEEPIEVYPIIKTVKSSPPGILSLPVIFNTMSTKDQVQFFLNTKRLTLDEVNDIGYGASNFEIIYTDEPEAHQPFVRSAKKEINVMEVEEIALKVQLTLHPSFPTWSPLAQKLHLTIQHHLTTEAAAAFIAGDWDNFEIIWDES